MRTAWLATQASESLFACREPILWNGLSRIRRATRVRDQTFKFQFDPGSTVTAINNRVAAALGLSKDASGNHTGGYDCFGAGDRQGYELSRFTAAGETGSYRVINPVVCWDDDGTHINPVPIFGRPTDALIGSNLFDDVEIVVNGPTGRIGVIQ